MNVWIHITQRQPDHHQRSHITLPSMAHSKQSTSVTVPSPCRQRQPDLQCNCLVLQLHKPTKHTFWKHLVVFLSPDYSAASHKTQMVTGCCSAWTHSQFFLGCTLKQSKEIFLFFHIFSSNYKPKIKQLTILNSVQEVIF